MKRWMIPVAASLALFTLPARSQTPVESGLWERHVLLKWPGMREGSGVSKICLKEGEASLERLVQPTPAQLAEQGCRLAGAAAADGILKFEMACTDTHDASTTTSKASVGYTPTSYDGAIAVEQKDKTGHTTEGFKGMTGKRIGDC